MRKYRWLILVLLLAGAVGLGLRLRRDWTSYRAQNDPGKLKLRPLAPVSLPAPAPLRDYSVVAQQNPFHPERNDAVPQAQTQPSGPPPLVFGSMILDKERFALMGTEANPRPQKVVEGETFNGYKLAEVRSQSVVLEAGEGKNEVMFYNALTRLRRDYTRTQSSAPAAPPPVATTTTAAPAPAAQTTTTVADAPRTQVPSPKGEEMPIWAPPHPGMKVMQTPWGPIWVDK